MFRKLNVFEKYWLKYTDRPKYIEYKWKLQNEKDLNTARSLFDSPRLSDIKQISKFAAENGYLNINHSGNAGDIIYALPTIKKIHELTGAHIHLYFKLGQPLKINPRYSHPLGNVMLNNKMVEMLLPLISQQPYIHSCAPYNGENIQIDMDYFRSGLVPLDKGNIARWCSYITGANPELWKKWLFVEPDNTYSGNIIIARSGRYNNPFINYSFLNNYSGKIFIGVKSEYEDIKKTLPDIEWIEVTDFLQMARMIAGCKFFIGNQSFPFSIAEALKVPRILETAFDVINVVPEGEGGHDFLFQKHFESTVAELAAR